MANYVLQVRDKYVNAGRQPGARATFESYCGAAHDALADVRGLHVVLTDEEGPWSQRGRKLAVVWEDFQVYGAALAAFSMREVADEVGEGWYEGPPPVEEEKEGPAFLPKHDCSDGGPSMKLKRVLGITDGRTLMRDELILRLFLYYFDESVIELICDATNSKATEQVVKEGKSFRPVRDSDPESVCRQRCQGWVALTPGEAYVYLGLRITMGAFPRNHQRAYWSTDDDVDAGLNLEVVSGKMRRATGLTTSLHICPSWWSVTLASLGAS